MAPLAVVPAGRPGIKSVHPVGFEELRALRKLLREEPENCYVFVSERGAPLSQEGFLKMVKRAGVAANLLFSVYPPHAPARLRLQARERWARPAGTKLRAPDRVLDVFVPHIQLRRSRVGFLGRLGQTTDNGMHIRSGSVRQGSGCWVEPTSPAQLSSR